MSVVVYRTLDSDTLKARLIAEVRRATGRTMTISGAVGVRLLPMPTLTLDDVALASSPGFSRPDLVRIGRVEVSVRLLPLLWRRVELSRVTLLHPDLLLESDRSGHANWYIPRLSGPRLVLIPVPSGPGGTSAVGPEVDTGRSPAPVAPSEQRASPAPVSVR